eukprot:scaffold73860_cov82-Phaeocystis_antarctica.AAC.1
MPRAGQRARLQGVRSQAPPGARAALRRVENALRSARLRAPPRDHARPCCARAAPPAAALHPPPQVPAQVPPRALAQGAAGGALGAWRREGAHREHHR